MDKTYRTFSPIKSLKVKTQILREWRRPRSLGLDILIFIFFTSNTLSLNVSAEVWHKFSFEHFQLLPMSRDKIFCVTYHGWWWFILRHISNIWGRSIEFKQNIYTSNNHSFMGIQVIWRTERSWTFLDCINLL